MLRNQLAKARKVALSNIKGYCKNSQNDVLVGNDGCSGHDHAIILSYVQCNMDKE